MDILICPKCESKKITLNDNILNDNRFFKCECCEHNFNDEYTEEIYNALEK